MKKLISIFSMLCLAVAVFAQAPGLNYNQLSSRMNRSNTHIEDPKKGINPKTWFDRGKLFQDINDVNTQFLRLGMSAQEALLFMNQAKEVKKSQQGDKITEEHVYDRVILIYEDGVLANWKETEVIHPAPLEEAYASFLKTLELDAKGKFKKGVREAFTRLKGQYEVKAYRAYSSKEYGASHEAFAKIVQINEHELIALADTQMVYFAGITAIEAGDNVAGIKYLEKAGKMGFKEVSLYTSLKTAYIAQGDSANALKALQEGFNRFQDNGLIVIELINFYLSSGESVAALEYLKVAKENDPQNKSLYFAEGTLLDRMGEMDKAVEAYKSAIEIDPMYFDAYFNLGVVYFNNAVKLTDVANEIVDNKKYLVAKEIADKEFAKSIPYMEKAKEINPDDKTTKETLRTLYYRLRMTDKFEAISKELGM